VSLGEIRLCRDVDAPRRVVWATLTDVQRSANWRRGVRVTPPGDTGCGGAPTGSSPGKNGVASGRAGTSASAGEYAVGTRWQERPRGGGRPRDVWVIEVQPPLRTVVVTETGGMAYRLTVELAKATTKKGKPRTRVTAHLRRSVAAPSDGVWPSSPRGAAADTSARCKSAQLERHLRHFLDDLNTAAKSLR